jgi:hypothetical protein
LTFGVEGAIGEDCGRVDIVVGKYDVDGWVGVAEVRGVCSVAGGKTAGEGIATRRFGGVVFVVGAVSTRICDGSAGSCFDESCSSGSFASASFNICNSYSLFACSAYFFHHLISGRSHVSDIVVLTIHRGIVDD